MPQRHQELLLLIQYNASGRKKKVPQENISQNPAATKRF